MQDYWSFGQVYLFSSGFRFLLFSHFYEEFFCSWTTAVLFLSFFLHNFDTHKTPSTVRVLYDILEYVVSWVDYYWLCRTVYSIQLFLQCLLGYRTSAIVRCYTLHVVRCTSTMVSGAWCSVCATVRMVRDMLVWYCVRYSLCSAVFCVLYGMVVSYNF